MGIVRQSGQAPRRRRCYSRNERLGSEPVPSLTRRPAMTLVSPCTLFSLIALGLLLGADVGEPGVLQVESTHNRTPAANAARVSFTHNRFTPQGQPRRYKGRVIPPTMSYLKAHWLVRPDREKTEQPEKVLDALQIVPGSTVADIGAGVGYFSLRLARRVGPSGQVLANDIQPEMIRMLTRNARQAGLQNVKPILSTSRNARLPTGQVDLALMVDVYHELSDPEHTMAQVRRALKPDGRLVLVEFRGEDLALAIRPEHKMTLRQVRYEIEPMGFRLSQLFEFLAYQHLIVFVRNDFPGPKPWVPSAQIPFGTVPEPGPLANAGFTPVFNGRDLQGWQDSKDVWQVRNGRLIARNRDTEGSILYTSESFGDFELELQWRFPNRDGRAAVWFRSGGPKGKQTGYRLPIVPGHYAALEHSDRGVMQPSSAEINALIVPDAWNRYTIRCQDGRVAVAVNGLQTADFRDQQAARDGKIGLELRQGTLEIGGIWIKRLPAKPEGS